MRYSSMKQPTERLRQKVKKLRRSERIEQSQQRHGNEKDDRSCCRTKTDRPTPRIKEALMEKDVVRGLIGRSN